MVDNVSSMERIANTPIPRACAYPMHESESNTGATTYVTCHLQIPSI
jgi:predicted membrane chloride channel (bestrophin family)